MSPRELLLGSFKAAVAAADPLQIVPRHLPTPPAGRTLVVGAGKAAAAMALAVEQHWPAAAPLSGTVITRYAHGQPTNRIAVVEAGHPVPDEAGEAAARNIFDGVRRLSEEDLLLVLISGGASSLLSLPIETITMTDLRAVTRELLRCGAPIQEINTVRKHLSRVQGGRLAAACNAKIVALIISDVTGDDATHVGSGPCAPDPTTYQNALDVLRHYHCDTPQAVLTALERGTRGELAETPKPGDKVFTNTENRVIATARLSLRAAERFFEANGVHAVIVDESATGEASMLAKTYAARARELKAQGQSRQPPVALISGGECTVTVRGKGRGGRSTEFLLSLVNGLQGADGIHAIACDTDGIDGTEDNAGAIAAPDTYSRATKLGMDADKMLSNNDSYNYFSALGDLVVTGPTRTNVNDYRAILVLRPRGPA